MKARSVLQLSLPLVMCALAFGTGEVWRTEDSSQWTAAEIDRILHNSPWAKEIKVAYDASTPGRRGGGGGSSGGGMGRPRISIGGPLGGGIGFPGGGGMGRGGGRGRGGGGSPNGGPGEGRESRPSTTVLVRWESAKPIQQALMRQGDHTAPPAEKHYVITVTGLQMPERRDRGDESQDTGTSDDRSSARRVRDPQQIRDQLLDFTTLTPRGRPPVAPDDVKVTTHDDICDVEFIFPEDHPISPGDKEVTFQTHMGPMKVESKFILKAMKYKGKLEL
jgi:hypothetical protein